MQLQNALASVYSFSGKPEATALSQSPKVSQEYGNVTKILTFENFLSRTSCAIYSALALNQMGEPKKARDNLDEIVNDSDVTPSTHQLAKQILAGMGK